MREQKGIAKNPDRLGLKSGMLLGILSGCALILAFPRFNLWPIAWVAFVPLFVAFKHSSSGRSLTITGVAGVVFFAGLLYWVALFGYAPWILLCILQSAFLLMFCALAQPLVRKQCGWGRVFSVAAAWTTVEWLRSLGTFGFTWGDLAQSQTPFLPFAQLASVTGPWGLSFVIVVANVAVYELWDARRESGATRKKAALRLVVVLAAVAAISVLGWQAMLTPRRGQPIRVAAIQANVDQELKPRIPWDDFKNQTMARYGGMTLEALESRPDLVVWPETAIPGYFTRPGGLRWMIETAARAGKAHILVGGSDIGPPLHFRIREYNGAYLFAPNGKLAGKYYKTHLVPFGEFVPGRGLRFLERYNIRENDVAPGRGHYPLKAGFAKLGVMICFESTFSRIGRTLTARGANLLVVMTNDGWFKRTAASEQHHAMSVLRAVENRRYVVRAAATGISSVIDANGRVTDSADICTAKVVTDQVEPLRTETLYTRFGDWFAYLCAAISAGVLLLRLRGLRRP